MLEWTMWLLLGLGGLNLMVLVSLWLTRQRHDLSAQQLQQAQQHTQQLQQAIASSSERLERERQMSEAYYALVAQNRARLDDMEAQRATTRLLQQLQQ